MKKVIFLTPWLSGYGGTETVIHNLFEEYYKNKSKISFRFELYSVGGFLANTNLHFRNVHVIQLFNNKYLRDIIYIFLLPFLIPYIIFKSHANVIISTNPILWSIAKIIIDIFHLHIPVVAWYHYSFLAKHVKKFYLTKPDYFLTISKAGKNELIMKNINKKKIYVIYNPIIPSRKTVRRSLTHNKFIYIGRIEYQKQKNICELFKALSEITSPWDLYIYGKGEKKDVLALKYLSDKLNISNNIHWMGFKENVFNHIKIADALILTSNYEGFPMVIAEAIAHGLYVISSNCPDGPSELINNDNGNLYKMHDIRELVYLLHLVITKHKCFSYYKVKNSISKMYISFYFRRFVMILKKIS